MRIRVALPVVVTIACCGAVLSAEQALPASSSVRADKVERLANQTLRLTGNVQMVENGFRLQADSVEVRESGRSGARTLEIIAEGNVVLFRGRDRLALQRLEFNPLTGTGVFQLPQQKP
jgi:lipopolysaccharide export system protein LptA